MPVRPLRFVRDLIAALRDSHGNHSRTARRRASTLVLETLEERLTPTALLFGNVYDDVNHDGLYEPGEGLGGVNVAVTGPSGDFQTTTTPVGAYQVQVPAGTYQVTASGTSLAAPLTQTVIVGTDNVEADFVRPLVPAPTFVGMTANTTSTTPVFSWTANDSALQYDLWVANVTTLKEAFNQILTTNSFTPATPLAADSYEAWINVTTPFGTSLWSPNYDFTIIPPAQPTLTAPIGSTPFLTPTFTWTASSDAARYDLSVSNLTTGQTQVIRQPNLTTNSFTAGTALPVGSYQASVQAFNNAGDTAGWSAALNFTISPPAAPTLTAPIGSSPNTNPTFTWTASAAATRYDLWVSDLTNGQTQIIRQPNLTTTSFTPGTALPVGTYQAWVQAFNSAGNTAGWSAGINFIIGPPPVPTLTAPIGSSPNTNPTFTWTASAGATRYDLWVSNLTGGQTQFIRQQNLTTTSFTPGTALPVGAYQAWVQAFNSAGDTAGWSAGISFTISGPAAPTLTAPTGSSPNASPTLTWTATAGATRYDLWVSDLTSGQTQFIRQQNLATTSFTPANPLPIGSYVAWVQAYNDAGALGGWSAGLNFAIVAPAPPTLTGPATTNTTPTFTWTASAGATQYDLWADNLTTGQGQVVRQTVTATSFTPASAIPRGQYIFWVRAANSAGAFGAWSAGLSFLFDTTAPAIPTITGPSSPNTLLMPTITWSASPGAALYDLWVNNLTTGQTQFIRQQALTANSFTPAAALTVGSYVAWVEAFDNTNQTRGWSASFNFTITPPGAPGPIGPKGSTTNTTPTFSWGGVTGAALYDLWVDDVTTGQTQIIRQQALTTNSYTPSTALAKGSYRFWVRAINANGNASNWSAEADFSIG